MLSSHGLISCRFRGFSLAEEDLARQSHARGHPRPTPPRSTSAQIPRLPEDEGSELQDGGTLSGGGNDPVPAWVGSKLPSSLRMFTPQSSLEANVSAMTTPRPSQAAVDGLLASLSDVIKRATSPDVQAAQALLLRRLAVEGDVIPSRLPSPRNITEMGGYLNLVTQLGRDDLRAQMLAALLGVRRPQPTGPVGNARAATRAGAGGE